MPRTLRKTLPEPEKAFLVYVNQDQADDAPEEAEMEGLCEAALLVPCGMLRQRLEEPHRATFLGKGKVLEVKAAALETGADLVLFDAELSGIQIRNLEEQIERRVIDRTMLILDIFARRARTREGQLQVELAQLTYMLPRLMSVYTEFERQRGGIGLRGPGEMKLETDRRLVRTRIARLREDLEEVRTHREQQRSGRRKQPYPFAAIVGYTSAGKSTLMNRLCGTELLADAMPFATLDPTTRRLELAEGYSLFLTDTVGFIRNLPTHLVAAFRATLEEVTEADFLILVVDISAPNWEIQHDAVIETLEALAAAQKPTITVFNKIDLLESRAELRRLVADWPDAVGISVVTGEGLEDLYAKFLALARERLGYLRAWIPYSQSALVEECYRYGRVLRADYKEEGIELEAELVPEMRTRLAPYLVSEK